MDDGYIAFMTKVASIEEGFPPLPFQDDDPNYLDAIGARRNIAKMIAEHGKPQSIKIIAPKREGGVFGPINVLSVEVSFADVTSVEFTSLWGG